MQEAFSELLVTKIKSLLKNTQLNVKFLVVLDTLHKSGLGHELAIWTHIRLCLSSVLLKSNSGQAWVRYLDQYPTSLAKSDLKST